MIKTGKAFRMATVPLSKQHIDMRYSRDDGMWYPSQPAALKSRRENSFEAEALGRSNRLGSYGKEKDIFVIICDTDEHATRNHDMGSAGYQRHPEVQRPVILILDVDSVQDPSSNQAALVPTPYPPTDGNGPLSADRFLPTM